MRYVETRWMAYKTGMSRHPDEKRKTTNNTREKRIEFSRVENEMERGARMRIKRMKKTKRKQKQIQKILNPE